MVQDRLNAMSEQIEETKKSVNVATTPLADVQKVSGHVDELAVQVSSIQDQVSHVEARLEKKFEEKFEQSLEARLTETTECILNRFGERLNGVRQEIEEEAHERLEDANDEIDEMLYIKLDDRLLDMKVELRENVRELEAVEKTICGDIQNVLG
ncbi:hypothetical protein NpPPO83_00000874 [Neofusicoccum parvum]|uniref:Uncharacterized protein n=1 Tax=Neofusicoccum parvum TaxID=310453 RepID=A0ACB5SC67_9PEZI|nr:hypothetical protein NpPPO83_00000874 [Neofusicoccum parvum]